MESQSIFEFEISNLGEEKKKQKAAKIIDKHLKKKNTKELKDKEKKNIKELKVKKSKLIPLLKDNEIEFSRLIQDSQQDKFKSHLTKTKTSVNELRQIYGSNFINDIETSIYEAIMEDAENNESLRKTFTARNDLLRKKQKITSTSNGVSYAGDITGGILLTLVTYGLAAPLLVALVAKPFYDITMKNKYNKKIRKIGDGIGVNDELVLRLQKLKKIDRKLIRNFILLTTTVSIGIKLFNLKNENLIGEVTSTTQLPSDQSTTQLPSDQRLFYLLQASGNSMLGKSQSQRGPVGKEGKEEEEKEKRPTL